MSQNSPIEWTDATWNPVRGCSRVSAGCMNCYAERVALRFGLKPEQPYFGLVQKTSQGAKWTGKLRLVPEALEQPLRWRKPRRIFVNSMSDLFHEDVPDWFITQVFNTIERAKRHTFQILTKRPMRMMEFMRDYAERWMDAPPNAWLGVSIEDQATADERIPLLLQTPAAKRFISAEPLLGPVDLDLHLAVKRVNGDRFYAAAQGPDGGMTSTLDWVITGGESGPKARPSHPDWFRTLLDQCQAAGVPFFFKQWGAWAPDNCQGPNIWQHLHRPWARWNGKSFDISAPSGWPDDENALYLLGKRNAGRLLDDREWNEVPA